MACYDIEGNTVDCTDPGAIGIAATSGAGDVNAGLDLSSTSPVAVAASSPSGPSTLSSLLGPLLNFGTTIANKVGSPSASNGLRLQTNPSTGQLQYYNPATGTYVGGPVSGSSFSLSGNSGLILGAFALVLAFLMFGGRRRATA